MSRFRGIIALDIDGTITVEKHILEKEVCSYLNFLINDGWLLVFVTGRTFSFAYPILSQLKGPFFLAVQNGAALYEMPEERLIKKNYIRTHFLSLIDPFFSDTPYGLLVESGREKGDVCFYKPKDFSAFEMEYLRFRIALSPEQWTEVESFDHLMLEEFAVGKFFAKKELAERIVKKILEKSQNAFNTFIIKDPFRPGWHLAHINNKAASKGAILKELAPYGDVIIAAGDDYNDLDMLKMAQVKIAMRNSPSELAEIATYLAEPASKQGIIHALKEAISNGRFD